jgi:hypothetical protein
MKYKTLFRLLLKFLGVWIFALAIPELINGVITLVFTFSSRNWFLGGSIVAPPIQMAIGAYFFWGGRWIVDKAIPSNRPYCNECGYELTGNTSNKCPECGTPTAK